MRGLLIAGIAAAAIALAPGRARTAEAAVEATVAPAPPEGPPPLSEGAPPTAEAPPEAKEPADGGEPADAGAPAAAAEPPAGAEPPAAEPAEEGWSFTASLYSYFVPDSRDYLQPTFAVDRDWLHLEARYNYEDLDTGSAWVGYNLGGGDVLEWELTPLLGGVFGGTDGVAFGYKGSLSWWKLELYSEGEYVIDVGNTSDSFFYNWSELTLAPLEWFRFGLVTQRTRAYDAERDIQRGLLFGLSWEPLDLTACIFNIDDCEPMVVVGLGVSF